MAKQRNIEIQLDEGTRNGAPASILRLGSEEIGFIQEEGKHFLAYLSGKTQATRHKSQEAAITDLIAAYHLHH